VEERGGEKVLHLLEQVYGRPERDRPAKRLPQHQKERKGGNETAGKGVKRQEGGGSEKTGPNSNISEEKGRASQSG